MLGLLDPAPLDLGVASSSSSSQTFARTQFARRSTQQPADCICRHGRRGAGVWGCTIWQHNQHTARGAWKSEPCRARQVAANRLVTGDYCCDPPLVGDQSNGRGATYHSCCNPLSLPPSGQVWPRRGFTPLLLATAYSLAAASLPQVLPAAAWAHAAAGRRGRGAEPSAAPPPPQPVGSTCRSAAPAHCSTFTLSFRHPGVVSTRRPRPHPAGSASGFSATSWRVTRPLCSCGLAGWRQWGGETRLLREPHVTPVCSPLPERRAQH